MKKHLPLLLFPFGMWVAVQATAQEDPKAPDPVQIETTIQKGSYAAGYLTSQSWKRQGAEFEQEAVLAGVRAGLDEGVAPVMKEDEMRAALKAFEGEMRKRMQERASASAETNKTNAQAFLAANKSKPGVTTTASGLQYKVLEQGTGPKPTETDTVSVHYRGSLIDGTEFDSSYRRGEPASFPVTGVIKGWTEALQVMRVGSKYRLFIPSELAYGADPRPGGPIGPHAALVFEVELIRIRGKK